MNKIQIVNWLLTRRCNLHCDYCRIVKNYKNQPEIYPPMKHYIENEMSTETVIEGLRRLKLHNPECFMILYGGEPLLRPDLHEIINYCNEKSYNCFLKCKVLLFNNYTTNKNNYKRIILTIPICRYYLISI